MKVLVQKQEGYLSFIKIYADWEIATEISTIDEWIRNLRLAKAWLERQRARAGDTSEIEK